MRQLFKDYEVQCYRKVFIQMTAWMNVLTTSPDITMIPVSASTLITYSPLC